LETGAVMNKLIAKHLYLLISILTLTLPLSADSNINMTKENTVQCDPQLQKCFQAILQIPEARNLINAIRKEGSIQIAVQNTALSKQLGAYWDPDRRIIFIDFSSHQEDGVIIGSLLFELHNASVNFQINHLNELAGKRKIDKDKYVESMEYLEYLNSINASNIAANGIKMGILPRDSQLPTYSSFEEHFKAQKMSGHSAFFERNYYLCQ
jgi:hypothetical protein